MAPKIEKPQLGALYSYTYEGSFGKMGRGRSVINSINKQTVHLENGNVLNLREKVVQQQDAMRELYSTKIVVPASQVKYPNVEAGDAIKLKTGDTSYRVEKVEDGIVHTSDGRSMPVTQVTGFDEDVSHDPFQLPGGKNMWGDL